jgi:hypothetical protein
MKKVTIGLSALLIGLVAISGIVFAFGSGFPGFGLNSESREAIQQAIESNNYTAWKEAMIATLTQENFDKLVERYKAMSERKELQDTVRQAIEAGDYEVYKQAVENLVGSYKVISEEDFNAMVERYNTTASGGGFGPQGGFDYRMRGFGRHLMP